jgi:hypothetical protein
MSVMTNAYETLVLNTMRGTTATAPASVYVALFLSDPTESGTAGTECSYSGYARQVLTLSAPSAVGTTVTTANTEQIVFPTPPGASGTVTHAAIMDASTAGTMLVYKALSNPVTLTSETAPRFAAGEITLTMAGGNLDPTFKVKVFNYLRATSISGFAPYLAMYNGDPQASGTELAGTGYARLELTFDTPAEQVSGQMQSANTNATQSAAANVNWGTYAYGVIMDAETSGNRVWYKSNAGSYTMNNGAQVYITAGAVTIALN